MSYYTNIDKIMETNVNFFEEGALSFFDSRIYKETYGGKYFITSEQFTGSSFRGARKYSVRQCVDGKIDTVGKFQEHKTIDDARRAIYELLQKEDSDASDIELLRVIIGLDCSPTIVKSFNSIENGSIENLDHWDLSSDEDKGE